jgi:hypothetical protein
MAFFSTSYTNSYIKSTSLTNLDRDGGNVIDPPLNAFPLGLTPPSTAISNPTLAGFDIGLPPAATAVSNPTLAGFTIGLPPAATSVSNPTLAGFTIGLPAATGMAVSNPSVPTFTTEELKIYNGTTVLFNLGVLMTKQQSTQFNHQGFTTVGGTAGTQGTMGDGRLFADAFTYTTFYTDQVTAAISEDIVTALSTATHIGLAVGSRLPIKPSGFPQVTQLAENAATITITVIPTNVFNLAGGLGV